MSKQLLVHALVVGGGVLALWVYVRLGERRPTGAVQICAHVVAAFLALALLPSLVGRVIGDGEGASVTAAALFCVFLPTMTYLFLAVLFFLEKLQRSLPGR